MDASLLAGVIVIVCALPGLALGLALLGGKWQPASLAAARDPDKARFGTACFLLVDVGLMLALGVALLALPVSQLMAMKPYLIGTFLVVTSVGAIILVRAVRA